MSLPQDDSKSQSQIEPYVIVPVSFIDMDPGADEIAAYVQIKRYRNNGTKQCNPGIAKVAARLKKSRRVIVRAINSLQKRGVMGMVQSRGASYQFSFPTLCQNAQGTLCQNDQGLPPHPMLLRHEPYAKTTTELDKNEESRSNTPISENLLKSEVQPRKKKSVSLPDGFGISDRVRTWASEKGFDRLEQHLECFIGYARANGKQYADWDQAFINAIRGDWAKLRTRPQYGGNGSTQPTPSIAPTRDLSEEIDRAKRRLAACGYSRNTLVEFRKLQDAIKARIPAPDYERLIRTLAPGCGNRDSMVCFATSQAHADEVLDRFSPLLAELGAADHFDVVKVCAL